jgi:hypothetical protein
VYSEWGRGRSWAEGHSRALGMHGVGHAEGEAGKARRQQPVEVHRLLRDAEHHGWMVRVAVLAADVPMFWMTTGLMMMMMR